MKIKRYKLKDGTTKQDLINFGARKGGIWINKDSILFISKCFSYKGLEFDIDIAFTENLCDWNDFDNILVLDDDFCQPYTPFYGENYGKDIQGFEYLEAVIERYNNYLDSLPFLEEVNNCIK